MTKVRLVVEDDLLDANSTVGASLAARFGHRGVGAPEGVVTAAVGELYTDTAATRGAFVWFKATGAGNTGWKVFNGDTGWRLVPADPGATAHPGIKIYLRRVGSRVSVALADNTSSAAGDALSTLLVLPAGFGKGETLTMATGAVMNAATGGPAVTAAVFVSTSDQLRLFRQGGVTHVASLSWNTDQAWPAALPGTAV